MTFRRLNFLRVTSQISGVSLTFSISFTQDRYPNQIEKSKYARRSSANLILNSSTLKNKVLLEFTNHWETFWRDASDHTTSVQERQKSNSARSSKATSNNVMKPRNSCEGWQRCRKSLTFRTRRTITTKQGIWSVTLGMLNGPILSALTTSWSIANQSTRKSFNMTRL